VESPFGPQSQWLQDNPPAMAEEVSCYAAGCEACRADLLPVHFWWWRFAHSLDALQLFDFVAQIPDSLRAVGHRGLRGIGPRCEWFVSSRQVVRMLKCMIDPLGDCVPPEEGATMMLVQMCLDNKELELDTFKLPGSPGSASEAVRQQYAEVIPRIEKIQLRRVSPADMEVILRVLLYRPVLESTVMSQSGLIARKACAELRDQSGVEQCRHEFMQALDREIDGLAQIIFKLYGRSFERRGVVDELDSLAVQLDHSVSWLVQAPHSGATRNRLQEIAERLRHVTAAVEGSCAEAPGIEPSNHPSGTKGWHNKLYRRVIPVAAEQPQTTRSRSKSGLPIVPPTALLRSQSNIV